MDEVVLSHSGKSEVHLTGYRVEQMMAGSDDDYAGSGGPWRGGARMTDGEAAAWWQLPLCSRPLVVAGACRPRTSTACRRLLPAGSEEGSEDEEQQESDEEEAPDAVPLKMKQGGSRRLRRMLDDEAEEGSEEEEEGEQGISPACDACIRWHFDGCAAGRISHKKPALSLHAAVLCCAGPQARRARRSRWQRAGACVPSPPTAAWCSTRVRRAALVAAAQQAVVPLVLVCGGYVIDCLLTLTPCPALACPVQVSRTAPRRVSGGSCWRCCPAPWCSAACCDPATTKTLHHS